MLHDAEVLVTMPLLGVDTSAPFARLARADSGGLDVPAIFNFALLRDGSITGYHRRDAVIEVVAPTGSPHTRHGAPPDTARAFGLLVALADFGGDSIIATDLMNARAVVVHPSAGIVRSFPAVFRDSTNFQNIAGRFPDGTWLLRPGYLTGGGAVPAAGALPERRPPMAVGRWREGGDLTRFDTLVLVPGWERVRARVLENGLPVYADLTPQYAARSHAVLWEGEAAVITNDDWSIHRYDAEGKLRSIIRIAAPRRTVTDSVRRHLVDGMRLAAAREWADHVDSVRRVTEVDSLVGAMVFADSIAPYERMHLAPGRRLWIQETSIAPGDPARLIGFEPDGSIVGRLEVPLPPGGQIAAMGDDRVVVRVTVPDGKSYVVVWRIRERRTEN